MQQGLFLQVVTSAVKFIDAHLSYFLLYNYFKIAVIGLSPVPFQDLSP
jgi:hypothetical protein